MATSTTEVITTDINVPFPETQDVSLKLAVGACQLRAVPGTGPALLAGTYRYPADSFPCKIEQDGGSVRLAQEWGSHWWGPWTSESVPRFDLALGAARPYALTLEVGASENTFELGGLPITALAVRQGAGKATLTFAAPNPGSMSRLIVEAGAMSLEMYGLGHANFAEMHVEGGAAGYKFDFGGTLQGDARVDIITGLAAVELVIPATTATKIIVESVMASVDLGDGFMKKEGAFWNEAALAGQTPVLTIQAKISLGGLTLRAA
jgi:hypothetical protein